MSDPYTPPSTQEEHPGTPPSNNHILLRRIGALALAWQSLGILWGASAEAHSEGDPVTEIILGTLGVIALVGFLLYGFLCRGKTFHLVLAIVLALSIAAEVNALKFILFHTEKLGKPLPGNFWFDFANHIVPSTIAFLCATALYLRARRNPLPAPSPR